MPRKIIELTLQLEVQKVHSKPIRMPDLALHEISKLFTVSCPGVWLCQDGRVSLTVFALDTSYQTCLLPPMFPLMFHDVFYFRKRFQETCAVNNICCLLKNETIYCELVQWCDNCSAGECTILAQYLGALNDVLFPSNMCSTEGVDLLMRRTKEFPGILAPKIEVSTKVRLDEIFGQSYDLTAKSVKIKACSCKQPDGELMRQKQVCHSPLYHRYAHGFKCNTRPRSRSRSRSRNCLSTSSCCSLKEPDVSCSCPKPMLAKSRVSVCPPGRESRLPCREYAVYNVRVPSSDERWKGVVNRALSAAEDSEYSHGGQRSNPNYHDEGSSDDKANSKLVLRSHFIGQANSSDPPPKAPPRSKLKTVAPCTCEICKRYHEMFNNTCSKSVNTYD